jgi:hypothetical protein
VPNELDVAVRANPLPQLLTGCQPSVVCTSTQCFALFPYYWIPMFICDSGEFAIICCEESVLTDIVTQHFAHSPGIVRTNKVNFHLNFFNFDV